MSRPPATSDSGQSGELLALGLNPRMRALWADLEAEVNASEKVGMAASGSELAAALLDWTSAQFARIEQLHELATLFSARFGNAPDEAERHAAILDFAEQLGASPTRLESDARALDGWFDADAVMERYRKRVGERERAVVYGLDRSGAVLAGALGSGTLAPDSVLLSVAFLECLERGWAWRGDARVRLAACQSLNRVASTAPATLHGFWVDRSISQMRRIALDPEGDAWAQCSALDCLLALSRRSLDAVLRRLLARDGPALSPAAADNGLFVRRHLARLLVHEVKHDPRLLPWLRELASDPEGAVRQAVAETLPDLPADHVRGYFARLRIDPDPQVRAMLLHDPERLVAALGDQAMLAYLVNLLGREDHAFVLRMALRAASRWAGQLAETKPAEAAAIIARLREAVARLRERAQDGRIRRWAGAVDEQLWLAGNPAARTVALLIVEAMAAVPEGSALPRRRLRELAEHDTELVGRVLAVLAQGDFGLQFRPGRRPRLWRGDRFAPRLWRILHELRLSATDKRQAFRHAIGRHYRGTIIAPPLLMAELAPTKVPGEPLKQASEDGWRNYLPLVDHVLSALDQGQPLRLFTSEGITTLTPPSGLLRRLACFFSISWRFSEWAALRNAAPSDYVARLRKLGLGLEHRLHADAPGRKAAADPAISRLFSFAAPLALVPLLADRAFAYFASVYQNTLTELAVFIALAAGFFLGRHLWLARRMRRMRARIPLVLGGWGTRGKSGTERLKAGLINALGHPLVSKTTGCEAMFLAGPSFGELRELFLFRPYDKATIWEQHDLIRTTVGLEARVFLWECMGLTPSYVRVLQQDWMRDDIATITNTYPDHEDLQGPAGRNIPEVMTEFIPPASLLLTTEEEMLPILRQGAERRQTRLRAVTWVEAGLIHEDLLRRFPYAEHPYNIALVTAMAAELGLEPDYAIREMADRVVADLGVLKTYPRSRIAGRTLEFVMGMSANERFGAMGNWDRMGFARHSLQDDPSTFVVTVVNNRADRVPRSRVFARILVEDIAADLHVLIGSNIDGLMGFIEEAWAEHAAQLTLQDDNVAPLERLEALARRYRIPLGRCDIRGRLEAMLAGLGIAVPEQELDRALASGELETLLAARNLPHADAVLAHITQLEALLAGYEALRGKLAQGTQPGVLNGELRAFLRQAFFARLHPVREYHTPGEAIVRLIATLTPPGLLARIMGMQNIKGTGLDFVYRWQAWEAVHRACQQALDRDPALAMRGVDFLASFQEYGALSAAHVRETVAALQATEATHGALFAARVVTVLERLESQLAASEGSGASGSKGAGSGSGSRFIALAEALLDSHDAVRRRRAADRIYQALIAEQISSARAAVELKKLTGRQKGGWLAQGIGSAGAVLARLLPFRSDNQA